jgi:RNA polymerase sigma-70 factor (ECF subfamily)
LAAREDDANRAFEALSQLCETYWYPLYAYIRRRGNDVAEAEDLTQSFFERFLERDFIHDLTPGTGRFRSFLLAALQHFLANEWNRSQARKRGGGHAFLSLDDEDARRRYQLEPRDPTEPELLYDRRWALTMLDQVLAQLRAEFTAADGSDPYC